MRDLWTEVDDRDFHRHAWCSLAGWVECIRPARQENAPRGLETSAATMRRRSERAPGRRSRRPQEEPLATRSLALRWTILIGLVLTLLWLAV